MSRAAKTPSPRPLFRREGLLGGGRLVQHHGQRAEVLLLLVLLLGVILVEAVAAEARTEGDFRGHRGRRHGRILHRVHRDGARLRAGVVHAAHNHAAERPQLAAIDPPRLAEPDQEDGVERDPVRCDDGGRRALLAPEATAGERPGERALGLLVQRASGRAQRAILGHADGEDALGRHCDLGIFDLHGDVHPDDARGVRAACERTL